MKRKKLLMTLAVLFCVASAVAQEEFKFEVTTTAANPTFAIPVSGGDGGKAYNWTINWGDGSANQNASGTGNIMGAGISHTYTTPGIHQITLTPNGSNDRWLAAFGFNGISPGANMQANKDLVTKVISPITPLMTRTQAEITANTTTPPNSEWAFTFEGCKNLTMGPAFTFSSAWNSITTVGNDFAHYMFSGCSGDAFKMNDVFNLPQSITTVGNNFACSMFFGCSGAAFKMCNVFNLPQNIGPMGGGFAEGMFSGCSGAAFTMNTVFNLPQFMTTVGVDFAGEMFSDCSGAAFKVNNVFKFPPLAQTEINKSNVFYRTFYNLVNAAPQSRTAASIINGNPTPNSSKETFKNSGCFTDLPSIPINWGGGEEFKFEVTTTAANQVFAIPLSGGNGGKAYNWDINWGDGVDSFGITGTGTTTHAGIKHTYASAGTYTITIKPAGSNDRWLAAFGFNSNLSGANVQTNKVLVTKVISPITPLMTRTATEISTNTTSPPDYEWLYTFYDCKNLTMGAAFAFSNAWNTITRVGTDFAHSMFYGCSGSAFKMNSVFNLPQNITTVGNYFAYYMFYNCSGAAFTMNDVFNLPQNITTVGIYFAASMFGGCSGSAFKMNDVFNLPQNLTTVGDYFAANMFNRCSGSAFKMNSVFNLPQNITTVGNYFARTMFYNCSGAAFQVNNLFKFPLLAQTEINKSDVFYCTFYNLVNAAPQSRTAASIINGNPTPSSNRETFNKSDCFADRPSIPINWGGGERFRFEVTTTAANQVFAIPVSGGNGGKVYNWNIYWGDGSIESNVNGIGSSTSAGISHTYITAGTYEISLVPQSNDYTDCWLAAFGFVRFGSGANVESNKEKVTKVISPITPLMTRTQLEITANTTTPPDYEWTNTFYGCKNLTMGPVFTFSNAWNSITMVGNRFADQMFSNCYGAAFTMNHVFNLPQNITTTGDYFTYEMFNNCSGTAFTMNPVFNLPQTISSVGNNFAQGMFRLCYGVAFSMSPVFNLPQNITMVGNIFALSMFYGCSGTAFTMNPVFNLPQTITTVGNYFATDMFSNCSGAAFQVNNVFKFPLLTQTEIDKPFVFSYTFNRLGTATTQSRTAASIINGNPTPSGNRETFTNSNCFPDRPDIPVNWGGDGLSNTFTVTYNYNGATSGNEIPSKTVTYNSAYGALPSPTKEFAVTYNYNGSAQANGSGTYNAVFGGWYKEDGFENEVTATTMVTTASNHTIYAKWTAGTPLILPNPAAYLGYGFAGWYKEAGCVNFVGYAGDSYIPTATATLYAKWVSGTFTIKATSGPNGNINPSGLITVNAGSNSTFNFKPNSGYKINKVLVDGVENTKAKADGFYTFKNVTQDHEISVTFSLSTGIETITNDELQITVFPNPTTGELTIENGELTIENGELRINNVEIYDVYGRKAGGKFPSNSLEGWTAKPDGVVIDISGFSSGLYFLKITTETGIVTKKVIKH